MKSRLIAVLLAVVMVLTSSVAFASGEKLEDLGYKLPDGVTQEQIEHYTKDIDQKIKSVVKDEKGITIYFEIPPTKADKQVYEKESDMPEPTEEITISVFVPDYQIKAVGDYRYRTQTVTSGLFQYSSRSAQTLSAAYSMTMAVLGAVTEGVATVIITGVQIAAALLAMNMAAQAKIYHHYVTTQSIGEIQYSDGLWTPYVRIAQRKRYKHYWGWAHRASDESPVQDKFDYNPPYPPIETLTKSHFADQTWIRNKAFECYYAGTYYYDIVF